MELKTFYAQDMLGNVIAEPIVHVYLAGTSTHATGLKDENGGDMSNPFTGTVDGRITVSAPDGNYDLRVVGAGRDTTMRVRFIDSVAGSANILRNDLATANDAAKGSGQIGYNGELNYASGTVGDALKAAGYDLSNFISSLADTEGASEVGYDGGTLRDIADAGKAMQSYTALRDYTGRATSVRITTPGIAGTFYRDDADTTSLDNGGTVIVDASGRRWKRVYTGMVNVQWFGGKGDYNESTGVGTDNTTAFVSAIYAAAAERTKTFAPAGKYLHTGIYVDITSNNFHIEGDGWTKTQLFCKTEGKHSIHVKNTGSAGQYYTFLTVKNLQINGNKTNGCGVFGDGIVWYEFESLRITNQGAHGIRLDDTGTTSLGSYGGVLNKVFSAQNGGDGFYQVATSGNNQANATWVTNCEFQGNANGITLWGTGLVVRDSVIQGSTGVGLRIMTTNAGASYPAQRISVKDNYFENNAGGHIYAKTRLSTGLIEGLAIEDNYYFSPNNSVGYIAVSFDCGGTINEVRGLSFKGNQFLFTNTPNVIADFGSCLSNDCLIVPRFQLSGTPDFAAASKYINIGCAKFDHVKSQTISGYFLSKGGTNISYTVPEKSGNITANGNIKFPLSVPINSSLVQLSVPVETDSTNYAITMILFGRSTDSTGAYSQIYNIPISGNSGSLTVKSQYLLAYSTTNHRVNASRLDMYLYIAVTITNPGTYFYLGNPTVYYV